MAYNQQSFVDGLINGDPMELVLSTPVLLEKILTELDNKTVFNSRLVSRSWNAAALTIFPKRPIKGEKKRALILKNLFKSSEISPKFDVNLAKSIVFNEDCSCGQNCKPNLCISTRTRFFEFWKKYSNQIEIFDFTIYRSTAAATLFSYMVSNRCENLKVLSFDFLDREHTFEIPVEIPQKGFSFVNLHTIIQKVDNPCSDVYQDFMQAIISRAPNLKRLKLGPKFYPDLSKNKKLVYLSHKNAKSQEGLNHKSLSRIFTQVKDSLETLKVFGGGENEFVFDPKDSNFPKMPKLKKLLNYDLWLHPMDNLGNQNLFEIINSKFPSLIQLTIGDTNHHGVQKFYDQLLESKQKVQDKIEALELGGIDNPNFLSHFDEWFPNLKKLTLCVKKPGVDNGNEFIRDNFIETVFSKLTTCNLKHFTFRANFKFFLSDFVNALARNMERFQGLTYLEFHANADSFAMLDDLRLEINSSGAYSLKTFFECLVDITKNVNLVVFRGFSFSRTVDGELMEYISKNHLPVKFVEGL